MLKDPELEKLKHRLKEWVYTNPLSFDVFLHKIPLSPIQRQIIVLRFVTTEHDGLRGFKEIESILNKSHDNVQNHYVEALKTIHKSLYPYIYTHLPNTM
jgi:hypothetical protein